MSQTGTQGSAWPVYKRLLRYLKGERGIFLVGLLATACYAAVDASMTYFVKPGIDDGLVGQKTHVIGMIPYVLGGVFLLRSLTSIVSNICMNWVGRSVILSVREALFKHLLDVPISFFMQRSSSDVLSAMTYNAELLAESSTNALVTFVREFVFVIGLIVVMFCVSWQLTLLFLSIVPFIALIARYSSQRLRYLSQHVQTQVSRLAGLSEECVDGARIIRVFGGKEAALKRFTDSLKQTRRQEMKVAVTHSLTSPLVQLLAGGVLIISVFLSMKGQIHLSAGDFGSILAAMLMVLKPLKSLATVNTTIQKGIAGAKGIFDLLDTEEEMNQGTRQTFQGGTLRFDAVSFQYPETDLKALSELNFSVTAGQTVALVGESGSGKSTFVHLLTRFYTPQSGTIYLDDIPLSDYELGFLRAQFAWVSQDVVLFDGSVAENIAYPEKPDWARVRDAATKAYALDFIETLPEGFETSIGENGAKLSGGQRQRMAIARAIYKDAPILILDEATSALDSHAEKQVQRALETLMQGRTTFVIAHRLSTVEHADFIVCLSQGKIEEMGSHEVLSKQGGLYQRLLALQLNTGPHHA